MMFFSTRRPGCCSLQNNRLIPQTVCDPCLSLTQSSDVELTTTNCSWSLSVIGTVQWCGTHYHKLFVILVCHWHSPVMWNSLPQTVHDPCLSLTQFCSRLKTFLFCRAYDGTITSRHRDSFYCKGLRIYKSSYLLMTDVLWATVKM